MSAAHKVRVGHTEIPVREFRTWRRHRDEALQATDAFVEAVRTSIRLLYGVGGLQAGKEFRLAWVYSLAREQAKRFPGTHKSWTSRTGVVRRMLQDERRHRGLTFISPGVYRYPLLCEKGKAPMRNRNVKEMLRDPPTAAPQAKPAKVESDNTVLGDKLKLAIDNVKPVLSLAPKRLGTPVDVPPSMRSLRDGDIEYVYMKPSEFVANIASPNIPGVGYQRPPTKRMKKLRAIAAKFDPRLLGLLHVWINEAGQRECLDGLGRLFVCLHLLRPVYDEPVIVAIHHHIKNVRQAAEWIRLLNPPEVARFNDKDTFHSRLTEQDPEAVAVDQEARAGGFIVGGTGVAGISVQAAEALHRMGKLTAVGLVKKNSVWANEKVDAPILIGLGGYMLATGDNSLELRETLDKNTPAALRARLHQTYGATTAHARITAARFSQVIFVARNLRRKMNRIKATWKRVDELMASPPWSDRWSVIERN